MVENSRAVEVVDRVEAADALPESLQGEHYGIVGVMPASPVGQPVGQTRHAIE